LPFLDAGGQASQEFDAARYLYVGLLMAGVGGQYAGGKISSRVPVEKALSVVFLTMGVIAIVFVSIAELGTLPLILIAGIFGFVLFAVQPLYQAAIAEHTPTSDRGLSYGLTYFSNFGVGALGAAIAGILLTNFIPQTVFILLAAIPITGAVLSYVLLRRS
jgi:predicted MFS family arabinose efflux permease